MPQAPDERHERSAPPEKQQLAVLAWFRHPVSALHESFVHELPSSQLMVVPPHVPPEHWSLLVHALLSLQAIVLFV
jgi:hypothetical protein